MFLKFQAICKFVTQVITDNIKYIELFTVSLVININTNNYRIISCISNITSYALSMSESYYALMQNVKDKQKIMNSYNTLFLLE